MAVRWFSILRIHFGNHDHILGGKLFVEDAESHHPPGMHPLHLHGQFFQILRVNIAPADDDDLFFAPGHKHFPIHHVAVIASQVPALVKGLFGQVLAVVIAGQQAVAVQGNLAHLPVRKGNMAVIIGKDAHLRVADRAAG